MHWNKLDFTEIDTISSRTLKYNELLTQSLIIRACDRGGTEAQAISLSEKIVNWLQTKTDFYVAPASTQFHNSFEGGLVYHSLQVYNQVLDLITIPKFQTVNIASAVFVALTHDWCKINIYEPYYKNVKDNNGNWVQEKTYRTVKNVISAGHGSQSLIDVMLFCNTPYSALSEDEMMAIRWHMYTYDVTSYDLRPLNNCCEAIPLVHLIQFADQLAITSY